MVFVTPREVGRYEQEVILHGLLDAGHPSMILLEKENGLEEAVALNN